MKKNKNGIIIKTETANMQLVEAEGILLNRMIFLLLCAAMVLCMLPLAVMAEDTAPSVAKNLLPCGARSVVSKRVLLLCRGSHLQIVNCWQCQKK